MKLSTFRFLATLLLALPVPLKAQLEGQGVLTAYDKTGTIEEALKSGQHQQIMTALWDAIKGNAKTGKKVDDKVPVKVALMDGYFYEAVLALTMAEKGSGTTDTLLARKSTAPLGAALLAAQALNRELAWRRFRQLKTIPAQFIKPGAQDGAGAGNAANRNKNRGKGGNLKGTSGQKAQPSGTVPAKVFTGPPKMQYYGIVAAAYLRDESASETIAGLKLSAPGIAGAKILYKGLTGEDITPEEVLAVGKIQPGRSTIARDTPKLSRFTLEVPDACLAAEGLGATQDEAWLPYLHKWLEHPDWRVKFEAMRAILAIGSETSLSVLIKHIPNAPWTVMIGLCHFMGEHPNKECLIPLIKRLANERGRIRLDINYALQSITRESAFSTARQWADWVRRTKEFTIDPEQTAEHRKLNRLQDAQVRTYGNFYGVPIVSDRFAYVVDSSASMKGGRIASLRENLGDSVKSLQPFIGFNIVDFGGDVCVLYPGTLTRDRKLGAERAENMPLTLGTRTTNGMDEALFLPLDTMIVLSDGAPVRSLYGNWEGIFASMHMHNRFRPVSISCVDFDPQAGNQEFMMKLAAINYGWHDSVDVAPAGGKDK